jgi:hypothetical protein
VDDPILAVIPNDVFVGCFCCAWESVMKNDASDAHRMTDNK